MKYLFSAMFILAFNLTAFCQYTALTGNVTDASGNPLQGASVFAQNTTIGTATDASGNFKIWLPAGGHDLVISFTGFNNESVRVNSGDNGRHLTFRLQPKAKEIADVAVVATNEVRDGWVKHGAFFVEQFIGRTQNSRDCFIRNPEVLKFYHYRRSNRLKVIATEPLLIENRSLGYNIRYDLDSFTHDYKTSVSLYTGAPLFEEIQTADSSEKIRWDAARRTAYAGSLLHFMRSIYRKDLARDGFEVQFVMRNSDKEYAVKLEDFYNSLRYSIDDSTGLVKLDPFQKHVGVIFTKEKPEENYNLFNEDEPEAFQFSVVNFTPAEPLYIEQNGYFFEQPDVSLDGYWTWERVADLLPYNYQE